MAGVKVLARKTSQKKECEAKVPNRVSYYSLTEQDPFSLLQTYALVEAISLCLYLCFYLSLPLVHLHLTRETDFM